MKQLHRITGIFVAIFVIAHLSNHCAAYFGVDTHQSILDTLRKVYRIPIIEILLIGSFMFQCLSGIRLSLQLWRIPKKSFFDKAKMYSGLILSLFLLQHIPATLGQRFLLDLDTNFYFAANVVVQKPLLYYFIPYYFLGVMAFAIHVAAIHREKILPLSGVRNSNIQMVLIILVFLLIALFILFVFTGGAYEFTIPEQYNVF